MTQNNYEILLKAIGDRIEENSKAANECSNHIKLSLIGLGKYMQGKPEPLCDELLKGSYGAAVEAVSLMSFALVRPAVLSLRSHYELSLQFLYYKDHPIEWKNVKSLRSQPTLPSVNKKYLRDNYPKFEYRFKALPKVKKRNHDDSYEILSGVAHGTAINSISTATKPEDLMEDEDIVKQAIVVFSDTSECLHDIHVSCFEGNWLSLPPLMQENLGERFGKKNPREELDL